MIHRERLAGDSEGADPARRAVRGDGERHVPFPVPLAPEAIVSQTALLVAVQAHPAAADTATGVPAPPAAPIDCDVGLIEARRERRLDSP